MTVLRASLILAIIMTLATTPALLRLSGLASSMSLPAYAATLSSSVNIPARGPRHPEKDDNRKHENTNDNRGNENGNSNGNGNGNGNGNSNDNNGNSNDNSDGGSASPPPAPRQAAPPSQPACSTPGQDLTVTSSDGRVTVHIFASMPKSIRLSIRKPVDPNAVPPAPGQKVDDLLFQLVAEDCNGGPLSSLPGEVNLGVHYTDGDVGSLNEASFKLSQLDASANQWRTVQKQASDPPANYISATVADLGYYIVSQP